MTVAGPLAAAMTVGGHPGAGAGLRPAGGMGLWRLRSALIFALGVGIVMNLALDPSAARSPRLLDLMGLAALPGLFWAGLRLRAAARLWVWGGLAGGMVAALMAVALAAGDAGRAILIGRVVLSVALGVALARVALRHRAVGALALGLWTGAVCGVALAQGQALGSPALLALMPVDAVVSSALGIARPSGIWGHPNAAAQVTMAGAAMILLLLGGRGPGGLWPVAAFVAVAVGNYTVMSNRAPLVVAAVVALVICLHLGGRQVRVAATTAALAVLVVLWLQPGAILGERWTATFNGMTTLDQTAERAGTALAGLFIALEQPLGHDHAAREARMMAETGMKAAHNGFVHAALVLGPWAAAGLLALLVRAALAGRGTARATGLGYATGTVWLMLMFEDAALEPSIVAVLACLAGLAGMQAGQERAELGRGAR